MTDNATPDQLEIQPASPEQREASFRNTHDVWSRGLSLEEHVAYRLKSPLHNRAQWFVGTLDGRVVTSLACHPLEFQLRGSKLAGFAIGSVHTLAAFRRRGFAPRLLEWVENFRRQRGDRLSVLYSDIDPEFYARLGYRQAPAWRGWWTPEWTLAAAPAAAEAARQLSPRLMPFDGRHELDAMAAMYAAYHGARPLSIVRSFEYWTHLFERQPQDEFFWLAGKTQKHLGYVRLKHKENDLLIADYALQLDAPHPAVEEMLWGLLCRLLTELARERKARRLGGWLPDLPASRSWFDFQRRTDEIPMFKTLDASVVLDDEAIRGTDCFCELDHV